MSGEPRIHHMDEQGGSSLSIGSHSSQMSDDELARLGISELVRRLRRAETDLTQSSNESSNRIRELNRRMQMHILELRGLKEVNQRLQEDNTELRDLCCFLDDDRQKGRKLAREWQRFGRYTASVMQQEVSTYQTKLRDLEGRQDQLIRDNLELKELCVYLDEERSSVRSAVICPQCGTQVPPSGSSHGQRDDGDGSSSSTNNDELALNTSPLLPPPYQPPPPPPPRSGHRERLLEESLHRHKNALNEQILHYIRSLEQQIRQLEDEKKALNQRIERLMISGEQMDRKMSYYSQERRSMGVGDDSSTHDDSDSYSGSNRPEAVVHAMKVLEVHEQLEKHFRRDVQNDDLAEGEKALVREMCNVVWRKLEDGPNRINLA